MNGEKLLKSLLDGDLDSELKYLYATTDCTEQRSRYLSLLNQHIERVGDTAECFFCSAPGRAEIGGNHTDHQNGRVLSAAVTLDVLGAVTPSDDMLVKLNSEGYGDMVVDISNLEPVESELGTPAALIRGVAAGMSARGILLRGFNASVISNVKIGSGISSSAAFEVFIATIFNNLCGESEQLGPLDIAIICKDAENNYFGKPCGLLDQCTSAVGGFVSMDFERPDAPIVHSINVDISKYKYVMCLLNTGCSHEHLTDEYTSIPSEMRQVAEVFNRKVLRGVNEQDLIAALPLLNTGCSHEHLTDEYTSIPSEMRQVAEVFNRKVLRGVNEQDLIAALPTLRTRVSDRAILRAFHFVNENERALNQAIALENEDFEKFLRLIRESGESSERILQNLYPISDIRERSLCLAQLITSRTLGITGAWRVHGGGFAGTLQVFLPVTKADSYIRSMEMIFGKGSVYRLVVRPVGGYCIGK